MGDESSGNKNKNNNTNNSSSSSKKRPKPGILRLDISKPRRSSGGSVEFRVQPELLGEDQLQSQTPITPQLSVKWAEGCTGNEYHYCSYDVDSKRMQENSKAQCEVDEKKGSSETLAEKGKEGDWPAPLEAPEINSEDEDYSLSVSAIMQRRASSRGRKKGYRSPRRGSSPMDALSTGDPRGDRRRSSVYTTSSGDTAISMDDGTNQESTQEQILENIRLHKEVLNSVKHQPWSMKRKLRLLRQAKGYVARHEGVLQERFAMSRNTKDLWARFKIVLGVKWQHWKRESANIFTLFIPWESRIKEIESHFGSVVASYFTFLRWLFWVNIVITIFLTAFVIAPEAITSRNMTDERKMLSPAEKKTADNFMTIWEFGGYLKYSPIFYGYYSTMTGAVKRKYHLPLAYFFTGFFVYVYSFIAILRKMAENSRTSKLSSKDDECIFSWKLFTGWDFMIGHAETAHNRMASVVLGFKEALVEEAEKRKDTRNWKVILLRIVVNLVVLALLVGSAYAVVYVVMRSHNPADGENDSWWRRNEISVVMNIISYTYPTLFEVLGFLENFHPRQQLRLQLARIMVLHFLNLYSLIFAQFKQITENTADILHATQSATTSFTLPTTMYEQTTTQLFTTSISDIETTTSASTDIYCVNVTDDCYPSSTMGILTTLFVLNLTTTALPDVWSNLTSMPFETTTPTFQENLTTLWTTDLPSTFVPETFMTAETSDGSRIEEESTPLEEYDYLLNTTEYYEYAGLEPFEEEKGTGGRRRRSVSAFTENPVPNVNITDIYDIVSELYQNMSDEYTDETMYDFGLTFPESEFKTTLATFLMNMTTISADDFNETSTTEYRTIVTEKIYQFLENVSSTMDPYTEYFDNCTKTICDFPDEGGSTTATIDVTSSFSIIPTTTPRMETTIFYTHSNSTAKDGQELKNRCWETMFGQELVKLIVSDLFVTIGLILLIDFLRSLFVRYMNRCWCWDLEKRFPQYGDFKVAENILSLIKDQGQVWMGLFFSPGLSIIYLIKLVIMMYIRSWAVLSCNVPHEVIFRASKSNNFYLTLLLTMLFLCVLPVAHAIVWISPSTSCGPFSGYERIFHIFTFTLREILPTSFHSPLEVIASPSIVIPLLLLLILIIYYLVSLTNALRVANQDLKDQLRKERSEERRKMLKLTEEYATENRSSITTRWKKVLEATSPLTPTPGMGSGPPDYEESKSQARKELLARIMKKALRKGSATSEEESIIGHGDNGDDGTDTEHHDSLPHDGEDKTQKPKKSTIHKGRKTRKPSLIDIVQLARRESISPSPTPTVETDPAKTDENDPDTNVRIVSERRRSLLKRQPKVENLPEATDSASSYDIINEKNKEVEKQSILKSTTASEPEVFKFDKEPKGPACGDEKSKKKVSIEQNGDDKKHLLRDSVEVKAVAKDAPTSSAEVGQNFPKGRRKFGSFLALVKEAAKKLDAEGTGKKLEKTNVPNVPPTITEHVETTSTGSAPESELPSKDDTPSPAAKHSPPKREDSQASIWSDNIPVITISKTESNECILEGTDKDTDKNKTKKSS